MGTGAHTFLSAALPMLLDMALKGAALLALAGLTSAALRRSSSAARHLVWSLAMAGLIALPVLCAFLPQWRVLPAAFDVAQPSRSAGVAPVSGLAAAQPTNAVGASAGGVRPATMAAAPGSGDMAPSRTTVAAQPPPAVRGPLDSLTALLSQMARSWRAWLVPLWAVMAALLLIPMLAGRIVLWRMGRSARRIEDGEWLEVLGEVSRQLSLRRPVALLMSRGPVMPMAWGVLRGRILLPADAAEWAPERRRAVLLHELAHVQRRDCLAQLVANLACALHWFNPLVWVARRRMVIERERACDDLVLDVGVRPSDYAEHLVQVVAHRPGGRLLSSAAIAMARPTRLESRIRALLDDRLNRRAVTRAMVLVGVLIVIGIALPLATLRAQTGGPKPDAATGDRSDDLVTVSGRVFVPAGVDLPMVYVTGMRTPSLERLDLNNPPRKSTGAAVPFSFRVKPGKLTVTACGKDLAPVDVGPFELKAGMQRNDIDIRMGPGFEAQIDFVTKDGRRARAGTFTMAVELGNGVRTPAGGPVQICTYVEDGKDATERLAFASMNGFTGWLHCSRVPLYITVSFPGFQTAEFGGVVLRPDGPTTLTVEPAGLPVTARLVDADTGKPVADARVSLLAWAQTGGNKKTPFSSAYSGGGPLLAESDSQGRLLLNTLSRDPQRLHWALVRAPGYAVHSFGPFHADQDIGDVRLERPLSIEGRVRVPSGTPFSFTAPYQPIGQRGGDSSSGVAYSLETHDFIFQGRDDDGSQRFRVDGLHAGKVVLGFGTGKSDGASESTFNWPEDSSIRPTGPGAFSRRVKPGDPTRMDIQYTFDLKESVKGLVLTPEGVTWPGAEATSGGVPRLRFLAWQDKDRSAPLRPWTPDGTPVTDENDLRLVRAAEVHRAAHPPNDPAYLHLWLSHPDIDEFTETNVRLLDSERNPVGGTDCSSTVHLREARLGDTGWIVSTVSTGAPATAPARVIVLVDYSVGPWTQAMPVAPDFGGMRLFTVTLSPAGQNAAGKTFIGITRGPSDDRRTQYDLLVETKSGKRLRRSTRSSTESGNVRSETHTFDVPLADVKLFHIRTRPIRTVEFPNVPLVTAAKPDVPRLQFRLVDESGKGVASFTDPLSGKPLALRPEILLAEAHVQSASPTQTDEGIWAVTLNLTPEGTKLFSKITEGNLNRQLAAVLDGKVLCAPVIRSRISGGSTLITLGGPDARTQAEEIARALNGKTAAAGPSGPGAAPPANTPDSPAAYVRAALAKGKDKDWRQRFAVANKTKEEYVESLLDRMRYGPPRLLSVEADRTSGWALVDVGDAWSTQQYLLVLTAHPRRDGDPAGPDPECAWRILDVRLERVGVGYLNAFIRNLRQDWPNACAVREVREPPGATLHVFDISGRVTDLAGNGIAGAQVWPYWKREASGTEDSRPPVYTDEKGRFELRFQASSRLALLKITADGYVPYWHARVSLKPDGTLDPADPQFALARFGKVSGRLVGPDGPMPLVLIEMIHSYSLPGANGWGGGYIPRTDGQGRFEIEEAVPGEYLLVYPPRGTENASSPAAVSGRLAMARFVVKDGAAVQDVVMDLWKSNAALAGRVRDARGAPVAGAKVYPCIDLGGVINPIQRDAYPPAVTDAEGRYRLDGLPPGQVHFAAAAPDKKHGKPLSILLVAGKVGELDLVASAE